MFCKKLVQSMMVKQRQLCHLYHRQQYMKSTSKLVYSSQQSFINVAIYSQLNEKFTDEEMELSNMFKDREDEMDSVHKGNNFSLETQEQLYSSNNYLLGQGFGNKFDILDDTPNEEDQSHIRRMQQQNLLMNQQQEEGKFLDNQHKFPMSMSFQTAMQKVESVYTAQDKLQIVQQYCLQIKSQVVTIDQKQREFLIQLIQPIIKNINHDPSQHNQCTLYALLNIAREDFLNIHLSNKVLSHIKMQIQKNYDNFELDRIKQVFYASCMKHKDTTLAIIEPIVLRSWFTKINTKIQENQNLEREMILFMSYHHKDIELFRKTHKFISHILLSNSDNILMRSKNAELLKVFISIYCKNEKGTLQLYEMFITCLSNLIQQDLISSSQFQVILRNLLRSHTFLSFRVISSYPECRQLTSEQSSLESASESDGEKYDSLNSNQEEQVQKKKALEINNSNQQGSINKLNLSFNIIDQFVQDRIEQMSCNQLLNVMNLYQIINAQNYRGTVIKILEQLKLCFTSNCDNHFSFNITIRALCLFNVENPQKYLSVYKSSPSKLANSNYALQIASTFNMVKEMIPQLWNKEFQDVYEQLLQDILKDGQKITMNQLKNQQYLQTPEKKKNILFVQQIFDSLNLNYSMQNNVETFYVDFFVKPSNPCKLNLSSTPFVLDITTPRDEMAPGIYNGGLSLKIKLLTKLKIPNVQLKEDFFNNIANLSQAEKEKALIQEINSQLKQFA